MHKNGPHACLPAENCSHLPIYDTRPIRLLNVIAPLYLKVQTKASFASGVMMHTLYRGHLSVNLRKVGRSD